MLLVPKGASDNDVCGFHQPNDGCGCGGDKSRPTLKCTSRDAMRKFLGSLELYAYWYQMYGIMGKLSSSPPLNESCRVENNGLDINCT